jgi:hypothetical protein
MTKDDKKFLASIAGVFHDAYNAGIIQFEWKALVTPELQAGMVEIRRRTAENPGLIQPVKNALRQVIVDLLEEGKIELLLPGFFPEDNRGEDGGMVH